MATPIDDFITTLTHPLKTEVILLRESIQKNFPDLVEIIKWNAPSYQYNGIDFLTFNLAKPTDIKLILHRGAKAKEKLDRRFISHQSKLLQWPANDRAVICLKSAAEIALQQKELQEIIQQWINQLGQPI